MSYNIKFGGGRIDFFFDCHGDRVLMSESEVVDNLQGLAQKIREVDPDLILMQEVDVASKRAAFVDQLQWLLDHTDLNYAVYASQWRADFVPSHGVGAVDSGNVIASKYPIESAERWELPLIEDQSGIERYFYLRRNLLTATVNLPTAEVLVVATHTEAFSQDGTKKKHIDAFKSKLDELAPRGLVLGGGDLNALPPGTRRLRHFDDSACTEDFEADDFRAETEWLTPLYRDYSPAIALSDYQADNTPYFSHTTDAEGFWNRKLDYLFTNGVLRGGYIDQGPPERGASEDHLPTMPLSDHAPLVAVLELEP
jgi:endonuclease/exonuclease/phosphatase family metal-dependent hydrolase